MQISLKILTEEDWSNQTVTWHGYQNGHFPAMATFFMKVSRMFCCPKPYILFIRSLTQIKMGHIRKPGTE